MSINTVSILGEFSGPNQYPLNFRQAISNQPEDRLRNAHIPDSRATNLPYRAEILFAFNEILSLDKSAIEFRRVSENGLLKKLDFISGKWELDPSQDLYSCFRSKKYLKNKNHNFKVFLQKNSNSVIYDTQNWIPTWSNQQRSKIKTIEFKNNSIIYLNKNIKFNSTKQSTSGTNAAIKLIFHRAGILALYVEDEDSLSNLLLGSKLKDIKPIERNTYWDTNDTFVTSSSGLQCNRLRNQEHLLPHRPASRELVFKCGNYLYSNNIRYKAILLQCGAFEIRDEKTGGTLWSSNTNCPYGQAKFLDNGNFVIYDSFGTARWATHTEGNQGSRLELLDNGTLVILGKKNQTIWKSKRQSVHKAKKSCTIQTNTNSESNPSTQRKSVTARRIEEKYLPYSKRKSVLMNKKTDIKPNSDLFDWWLLDFNNTKRPVSRRENLLNSPLVRNQRGRYTKNLGGFGISGWVFIHPDKLVELHLMETGEIKIFFIDSGKYFILIGSFCNS